MEGKVYLTGAGPGDAELITVKGMKAIQQADVILYDRLINEELLEYARKGTEFVYCGKRPDRHSLAQGEINELLCRFANEGKTVTRLKGGDPFIFGRGGEEAEVLRQYGIHFEIIPGISSGSAAPAYAGIPLTHRDYSSSVAFVSGVGKMDADSENDWKHLAQGADTLCIYMGVKNLPDICRWLMRYGRNKETPIALVHRGTTENQHTVIGTLENIVERSSAVKNPSMIIVGEVVRLSEKIQWFEDHSIEEGFLIEAITG